MLALNYSRVKKLRTTQIIRHGWNKPQEGFVKLNVDATFDMDTCSGRTGAIIRDCTGSPIAGDSWNIPTIDTPSTAEACALRDGLIIAGNVGCNRILVESDCMEVVEVMQNGGNSLGVAVAIYEEYFPLSQFTRVIFSHCPREANRAAHLLASQLVDANYT